MNNQSFRIKANPGEDDPHLTVKLEQSFESLDILSLSISQSDLYRSFSADYGCVVGRVIASGVGIPNAKVSVFIPLDPDDEDRPEILQHYPFKTPRDQDNQGIRYNLLPRLSALSRIGGWIRNRFGIGYTPKTPVGTFPTKAEMLIDETFIEVYQKYYKFTTTTNQSGDFMLMGVPVGRQTLHMDVDMTDIGRFSMRPVTMKKKLGFPASLFTADNKVKRSRNLTDVPNIQSMDLEVDVIPLWGDEEESDTRTIGLTRQDFNLNVDLTPSFVICGSNFTMAQNKWWGDYEIIRMLFGLAWLCFDIPILKKTFPITIKLPIPFFKLLSGDDPTTPGDAGVDELNRIYGGEFDLPAIFLNWMGYEERCAQDVSAQDAFEINDGLDLRNHRTGKINMQFFSLPEGKETSEITTTDDLKIYRQEQPEDIISYVEDGDFAHVLFCNRNRKVTNEFGNLVPSEDENEGIFTEWEGFAYASMDDLPIDNPPTTRRTARVKMKLPQSVDMHTSGGEMNMAFFQETFTFEFGKVYSVAQLLADETRAGDSLAGRGLSAYEDTEGEDSWDQNVGHIRDVSIMSMEGNVTSSNGEKMFGNEWLNLSLYFLQYQFRTKKGGFLMIGKVDSDEAPTNLLHKYRISGNNEKIGPNLLDSRSFNRGDRFQTDFIEIPPADLSVMVEASKGFTSQDETLEGNTYRGGTVKYFYRGLRSADCFRLLVEKNLI